MTNRKPHHTISQVLKPRNISQLQAACDLGLPHVRLDLIANGGDRPKPEVRTKVAWCLVLPEAKLFDGLVRQDQHDQ